MRTVPFSVLSGKREKGCVRPLMKTGYGIQRGGCHKNVKRLFTGG